MSDAAQVALIAGICNILAIVAGRWLSHREHKNTAQDVRDIKDMMHNGKEPEI